MDPDLASELTKRASRQTFQTIRYLVDRPLREDAFRAYAYFRWVDDVLDAEGSAEAERRTFLDSQESLLDRCLRGRAAQIACDQERMLTELVQRPEPVDAGLEIYLRQMMRVMRFDVERRGRLISQTELDEYTSWLATAVTEAMHYFIRTGTAAPFGESRYAAVTGAHVLHMLRDTCSDVRVGYFNVPREVLEANSIGPADIGSDAYRAWVANRVQLARDRLEDGRAYLAHVPARRHRVAVLAYIARFEWLIQRLENDEYRIRPRYPEARGFMTGLRMGWQTMAWMTGFGNSGGSSPIAAQSDRRS